MSTICNENQDELAIGSLVIPDRNNKSATAMMYTNRFSLFTGSFFEISAESALGLLAYAESNGLVVKKSRKTYARGSRVFWLQVEFSYANDCGKFLSDADKNALVSQRREMYSKRITVDLPRRRRSARTTLR